MSKHTAEPWLAFVDCCEPATPHPDSDGVVRLGFEDYQRARACVNAMAGVGEDNALFSPSNSVRSVISSMKLKELRLEQECDELKVVIKELELLARQAGNVAYNLGQSHNKWPSISQTLDELHAVRMKALDLCSK